MTLPKSKVLSSSRSIKTIANVNSDIQKTNQIQNVNVVVQPSKSEPQIETQPQSPPVYPQTPTYPYAYEVQPAAQIIERSAQDTSVAYGSIQQDIETEIQNKDNMIKALSLIIDILESNPLIINKYIIASTDNLQNLILLLTNAQEVEFQFDDPEVGCFCKPESYYSLRSIYVHKDGNQYVFKHAFPQALRILDNHKISTKIVTFEEPTTKIIEYNN